MSITAHPGQTVSFRFFGPHPRDKPAPKSVFLVTDSSTLELSPENFTSLIVDSSFPIGLYPIKLVANWGEAEVTYTFDLKVESNEG